MIVNLSSEQTEILKIFLNFHGGINYKSKILKAVKRIQHSLDGRSDFSASELIMCVEFLNQGVNVLNNSNKEEYNETTQTFKEKVDELSRELQRHVDKSSGRKRSLLHANKAKG